MGLIWKQNDPFQNPLVFEMGEMITIRDSFIKTYHINHWGQWLRLQAYIIHLEMHMEKYFQTMNEIRLNQLFPK